MDDELKREKAAINELIAEFSGLMDRVNGLQREIGDRLRAFSETAPLQGLEGEAATRDLLDKARRAISKINRFALGGDPHGPV